MRQLECEFDHLNNFLLTQFSFRDHSNFSLSVPLSAILQIVFQLKGRLLLSFF